MITAAMPKPPQSARHGGALKLHRDCGFGEVSIASLQPKAREIPPLSEIGTAPAIKYLTSGVAALFPSSTGRGGARNRADRVSHALTVAQIANLKAAERYAERIGLPFNRMISIHWEGAGVPLASMAKATGRFTDLLTKALARHSSRTAWLWTHENVPGNGHDNPPAMGTAYSVLACSTTTNRDLYCFGRWQLTPTSFEKWWLSAP